MNMKHRIKYHYLKEVEIDELYYQTYLDLGLSDSDIDHIDHNDIFIKNPDSSYQFCTNKISIDSVIKTLSEFKKDGATHVEIMNHEDHRSFIFNSLKISLATASEIEKEDIKDKELERIRTEKEIETLISKLNGLNKTLGK